MARDEPPPDPGAREASDAAPPGGQVVLTVGHSTRSAAAFLHLLEAQGVERLVDVRRYPGSRRHPHFDREEMVRWLGDAGVVYRHEEVLGGRRGSPRPDSPNRGWRSEGFRAYADHMNGPEAQEALSRVIEEARSARTALMCAEAVPWRCHRQIVADHLVARGLEVRHVLGPDRSELHELRDMARRLEDGRLVYPSSEPEQGELFRET